MMNDDMCRQFSSMNDGITVMIGTAERHDDLLLVAKLAEVQAHLLERCPK